MIETRFTIFTSDPGYLKGIIIIKKKRPGNELVNIII